MNLYAVAGSANQLTVVSILAILIVVGVTALHRGWIVLGSTHKDCMEDKARAEKKVEETAIANELKITRLEEENTDLRNYSRRGSMR